MNGYLHKDYAQSLEEFGTPFELPHSQGWCVKRQIPEYPHFDAMGSYPIFACQDWNQLHSDIAELNSGLISISMVTDPFGDYTFPYLQQCFPDVTIPFKKHFVIDMNRKMENYISNHHQRYAHKSLNNMIVEKCDNPKSILEDWMQLYSNLIERHKITGISAFSEKAFVKQLEIPGIVVFRAIFENTTVGILLWYVQNDIAFYHLGAYSESGYNNKASFALFWHSIKHFSDSNLKWLSLGAGAGLNDEDSDGLSRFKKGWSTDTRLAYFCGKILDHDKYSSIVNTKNKIKPNYFPAYRSGEFG